MMKKNLIATIVLAVLLLTTGVASAHGRFGFGIFIAPPIFVAPAPVYPYPYPYHYRPYRDYGPYDHSYREWVPGYWEERWGPYGWERAWVPGYWRYYR
jgi:hypothetical protein